MKDILFPDER